MADHQYTVNGKLVTHAARSVKRRVANGKQVIDIARDGTVDGKLIMSPAEWKALQVPVPVPVPGLPTPSANWTTVTGPGQILVDDQYMKWEIKADRRIYRNDVLIVPSNDVDELKISDARKVWQGNEYGWWMWLGTGWGPTTSDPQITNPKPPDAPPTDTTPDPNLTHAIYFDGPGDLARGRSLDMQSGTGGWYASSNVSVANGALRVATDGQGSNANFQLPGFAQTYGRWVIRWKLEQPSGGGMCFLLWPTTNNWPIDGEIDLMENFSKGGEFWIHNHWGADNRHQGAPVYKDLSQWITTELIWKPNQILVNVDGVKAYEQWGTPGYEIPDGPMMPAFQSDGPATWIPASGPNALLIDSLKIYSA